MKIRRCADLLLGAAVPVAPPRRFELPPPSPRLELPPSPRFELPPPAQESHAGFASKISSSLPEPCVTSFYPRDLMDQLDLSDPQEEERFMETYSVPVARRASWPRFPASMSAGFIKEDEAEAKMAVDMVNGVKDEEKEYMGVDMVNGPILEPCVPKDVGRRTARKKNDSKPKKTKKGKENAEEIDGSGGVTYTCKKNDGKNWSCRRPVSQPDTLCSYHSDPKQLPGSLKPRRKRVVASSNAADEEFYCKRHRGSSSRSVPEPAPSEQKVEAQLERIDVTPDQAQADGCDDDDMAGIAGYVEDTSSDDDVKRKNHPVKRRKRKPVNTRSINSLM
uniref:Uncharacterized protein n=1 Tax=Avena sativa TaxID=4498 RepID=A0ACD6A7A9_AVESA